MAIHSFLAVPTVTGALTRDAFSIGLDRMRIVMWAIDNI